MDCDQPIEELIQRSSFGAPKARQLSDRTPDEVARRIVDRVREHLEGPEPERTTPAQAPEAMDAGLEGCRAALSAARAAWRELLEHETSGAQAGEAADEALARLEALVATHDEEFEAARAVHERLTSMLVQRLLDDWAWRTAGQLLDPVRPAAAEALQRLGSTCAGHTSLLASVLRESQLRDAERSEAAEALGRRSLTAVSGEITPTTPVLGWLAGSYAGGSVAYRTPVRRCMLAFDIEGFSRPDHSTRLAMRSALRDLLDQSLSSAGIDRMQMELADFGDGALVLIDPQVSRTMRLLHPLILQLAGRLARYNSSPHPRERLRLRVVVHGGEVQRTETGFAGEDVDLAFRLLSARALRSRLAHSQANLALIISDEFFKRVVAQADQPMSTSFQPVQVKAKAGTTRAWVGLPPEDRAGNDSDAAESGSGPPREFCRPR